MMNIQFGGRSFLNHFERTQSEASISESRTTLLNDKDVPHLTTFKELNKGINEEQAQYTSWKQAEYNRTGMMFIAAPIHGFDLQAEQYREKLKTDFSNPAILNTEEELKAYAKNFPHLSYLG